MRKVGKMVLNQNIDNFHNESEQIAFNPGTVVPGMNTMLFALDALLLICPVAIVHSVMPCCHVAMSKHHGSSLRLQYQVFLIRKLLQH